MFSGLSSLVIEGVDDDAGTIVVRASTPLGPVSCPGCAIETGRVHAYIERRVADVPVDGRPVVVRVRARRMRCLTLGCSRQTFREQPVGVTERYQRRTTRLAAQVGRVVREVAGRAGVRVLAGLGVALPRQTALRPAEYTDSSPADTDRGPPRRSRCPQPRRPELGQTE